MTTGYILPTTEYAGHPSVVHPSAQQTWVARDLLATFGGTFGSSQPISIRSLSRTGQRSASFFEDYYNRFHLLPAHLRYGSVSGVVTKVAVLWSAWTVSRTIDSIAQSGLTGVTLVGHSAPAVMPPLSTLTYNVKVGESGPADINGTVTYHADNGQIVTLTVTGQRSRLWPFEPTWSGSVDITYAYKTDVTASRSGKEQRRAQRITPRKTLDFSILLEGDEYRAMNRLLTKWSGNSIIMADPTRFVTVLENRSDGSVEVDSIPDWLAVGRTVIIDGAQRVISAVDPVAFTGDTITYPVGTAIRPSIEGLMKIPQAVTTPTSAVAQAKISFNVTPASEPITDFEWPIDLHNGREVFTLRPNWGQTVSNDWFRQIEQVDFGRGVIQTFRPVAFATRTQKATYLSCSATMADDIRRMFDRAKGKRGEFYMPTFEQDLTPLNNISVGTDTITVAGTATYDDYADDTVNRAVCIRTVDGRRIYRSIRSMYVSGGNTGIQFSQAFLSDISTDEIIDIAWMPVRRFASDELTIEWVTDSIAQTSPAIMTLEDLTPEGNAPTYDEAAQWFLEAWGQAFIPTIDRFDDLVNFEFAFGPLMFTDAPDRFDYLVNDRYPEIA